MVHVLERTESHEMAGVLRPCQHLLELRGADLVVIMAAESLKKAKALSVIQEDVEFLEAQLELVEIDLGIFL